MKNQYDYLIVGSGLAGLYTALRASSHGKVLLVTKDGLTDSNSYNAQGGIAAVSDIDDMPEKHFDDTIVAGRGLCDYPMVDILVHEGPDRIRDLISRGMHFDETEEGKLALGLEGGHHMRRILHAGGDATGRLVTGFVLEQVRKSPGISLVPHCTLLSLVISGEGRCCGVRCWNFRENREETLTARFTVLSCGGTAALYGRSTNPSTTTGDGIAIAYDAGCRVEDMEFIQFHPTAISKEGCRPFLVSEAVRGEGAHLYNLAGERFMLGAHELNELAPRDIVAQMIDRQIKKEGKGYVYLTLSHLDPEKVKARFPTIFERCKEYGIDMCDRIPVAPAAHYTVGGVCCDSNGATDIPGLYVCGEIASTGIMGANRLASNSLIECMVFAERVVRHTVSYPQSSDPMPSDEVPHYVCVHENSETYMKIRRQVSEIVDRYAGIVRNEAGLLEGLRETGRVRTVLRSGHGYAGNEVFSMMSENLLTTADLILSGTLFRKESRGCLYRSDFPEESSGFSVHTVQRKGCPVTVRKVEAEHVQ